MIRLEEGMPTSCFTTADRCAGAFVQTLAAAWAAGPSREGAVAGTLKRTGLSRWLSSTRIVFRPGLTARSRC